MPLEIKEKAWNDIRMQVQAVNPELTKVIDELKPDSKHTVFTVKLPFGFEIFQQGKLHSELAQNNLAPFGLVLDKTLEIYLSSQKRPLPYFLLPPGDLFGWAQLIETFFKGPYQNAFCWEVTSGLRSLFLLPKISNATQLAKLYRKYPHLDRIPPVEYAEHWQLFRQLVQASESPWQSEILFFSQEWFKHLDETKWLPFYLYGMGEAIKKQSFPRDSLRWQYTFSKLHEEKFANYPEHVVDTIKHLFAIGSTALPGFVPLQNDEGAPISYLQSLFAEVYELEYQPIFMGAAPLGQNNEAVYYSLQYPTAIDIAPRLISVTNAEMLDQMIPLLKRSTEYFRAAEYSENLPMLYRFAQEGTFAYYHHLAKMEGIIKNVTELFAEDARFTSTKSVSNAELPINANFFKGCIKALLPKDHAGE